MARNLCFFFAIYTRTVSVRLPPMYFEMFLLFIFLIRSSFLIEGKPQVPCLFIFGDSLFDNGNNNDIVTLAKVDFSPYGIDYPGSPTGRFCNGRIIPDFIGKLIY